MVPFAGVLAAVGLAAQVARRAAAVAKYTMGAGTTRAQWYRKVKRVGNDQAVFDVTIPKPLGIKLEPFPQAKRDGVGVSQIIPEGNTDKLNHRVCVEDDGSGMWVLEGDRVMAVNGEDCENATSDDIAMMIVNSESTEITLTLMRNTRIGPVKVVLFGPIGKGNSVTVRRNCRLNEASEYCAGRELKYGCVDGWCGTCWHRERTTNRVFKPCCDVVTGEWDNVMPLVMFPKPEKAGDASFMQPRGQ